MLPEMCNGALCVRGAPSTAAKWLIAQPGGSGWSGMCRVPSGGMRAHALVALVLSAACLERVADDGRRAGDGACTVYDMCWSGGDGRADEIANIAVAATLIGVVGLTTIRELLAMH
jgi:hypothetical protein